MHEEGFRAHEWEIVDNLSCLGEVMEMVKRGRMKGSTSGRCSPDSHGRYHFLGAFILSKGFDCIHLDPESSSAAPWEASHPPEAPPE